MNLRNDMTRALVRGLGYRVTRSLPLPIAVALVILILLLGGDFR